MLSGSSPTASQRARTSSGESGPASDGSKGMLSRGTAGRRLRRRATSWHRFTATRKSQAFRCSWLENSVALWASRRNTSW